MSLRTCHMGHHGSVEKGKGNEMEREVRRITVGYSDGSSREVRKGLCLEFTAEGDGGQEMVADMVGLSGMDLIVAATAFMELVNGMGLSDAMLAYIGGYQKREGAGDAGALKTTKRHGCSERAPVRAAYRGLRK